MAKKSNSSKYIKIVVALVIIIAAVLGIYYMFFDKTDNNINDITEAVKETISENVSVSASSKADTENTSSPTVSESSTAVSAPETTTVQAKNYELPLSINQAMLALEGHYGADYDVNSTIEEDGINYFALYKDDEKYASVAVNLMTGEATETIMETNQKTDFYLV